MNNHSLRFVDYNNVIIFIYNIQRNILRSNLKFPGYGNVYCNCITGP